MFKAFVREFEAQPKYEEGATLVLRYDVANGNGVLLRGTKVQIAHVVKGNYCQGIRYTVEDAAGNVATGVDESMLCVLDDAPKKRGIFSFMHQVRRSEA